MNIRPKVNIFFSVVCVTMKFKTELGTDLENHCQDKQCQTTLYSRWLLKCFLYLIVLNTVIL